MNFVQLGKPVLIKNLRFSLKKSAGRNNQGVTVNWHRGGGTKRNYRFVDYRRDYYNLPAVVRFFDFRDSYKSSPICMVAYRNGALSYVLASKGLQTGDVIINWNLSFLDSNFFKFVFQSGNSLSLDLCPIGSRVFNLSYSARSGGASIKILRKVQDKVLVEMPSKELKIFKNHIRSVVGSSSLKDTSYIKLNKAGQSRWLGIRPTVRGVAMNPVDHPHGGDTSGGRCSSTPWGRLTKGKPTRSPLKPSKLFLNFKK